MYDETETVDDSFDIIAKAERRKYDIRNLFIPSCSDLELFCDHDIRRPASIARSSLEVIGLRWIRNPKYPCLERRQDDRCHTLIRENLAANRINSYHPPLGLQYAGRVVRLHQSKSHLKELQCKCRLRGSWQERCREKRGGKCLEVESLVACSHR